MSEREGTGPAADADPAAPDPGDAEAVEEVDGLPVLAEDPSAVRASPAGEVSVLTPYALRTAAVAAGGVVAGVAVVGLVRRHRSRAAARARRQARRGPLAEVVQIVGTRSVLVDVHLLGGRGR